MRQDLEPIWGCSCENREEGPHVVNESRLLAVPVHKLKIKRRGTASRDANLSFKIDGENRSRRIRIHGDNQN